jgi:hypothetical protein
MPNRRRKIHMAVVSKRTPVPELVPVKRALLSVSDKTGLIDFAKALAARGVSLVSTGGTRAALSDAGLAVSDISEVTGFPEIMDGRVKTLHPKVHGGLLAIRDDAEHAAAMTEHGIEGFDLVCVNLYPFEDTVAKGADFATAIENIDIGGPAMTRAAAKNHAYVTMISDPADYAGVIDAMDHNEGQVPLELRKRLAQKAFARTAAYDAAVSNWFATAIGEPAPPHVAMGGQLSSVMRYGENPHQQAAFYTTPERRRRRHRPAGAGQGAVLQQHQRHGRRFRTGQRVRSRHLRRRRDHQARQSLRRRRRRSPSRPNAYEKALALRSRLRLRRHRRPEPPARRRRRRPRSSRSSPR